MELLRISKVWIIFIILFIGSEFSSANLLNSTLKGDIDGDGRNEIITWNKFATSDLGDFYQLKIYDNNGQLLWQGPKVEDTENPYIFGRWDFGESMPEALIDIDNDGQAELLAPSPTSDVSPIYYRIFSWNGRRLVNRRPAVLMRSKKDLNHFIWVNPYPGDGTQGSWVSSLEQGNSAQDAIATVTQMQANGNSQEGKARLFFNSYGAKVLKWILPLPSTIVPKPPVSNPTLPNSINSNNSNICNRCYIARISIRDHYNSQGERLMDLKSIIHQDRANFYNGLRDSEDTAIGIFSTVQQRNMIDNMPIEAINIPLDILKRDTIMRTPLLRVRVLPYKLQIEEIGR